MKKFLLSILGLLFLFSIEAKAESIFKFKVPSFMKYPKGVSFSCDEGVFSVNAKGNYERPTAEYHSKKWIQVKNSKKEWIDSFHTYNLFYYCHLSLDGTDLSRMEYASREMLDSMKLSYRLMDEDVLIQEGPIQYATFIPNELGESSRMRTLSSSDGTYKIGNLLPQVGGKLIIMGLKEEIPSLGKTEVSSAVLEIIPQELFDSLKSMDLLFTRTPVIIEMSSSTYSKRVSPLKEGYILKGSTTDGSEAIMDESKGYPEIVRIVKSLNLKGMHGDWSIYLPGNKLYATGTIILKEDKYYLGEDWVIYHQD